MLSVHILYFLKIIATLILLYQNNNLFFSAFCHILMSLFIKLCRPIKGVINDLLSGIIMHYNARESRMYHRYLKKHYGIIHRKYQVMLDNSDRD